MVVSAAPSSRDLLREVIQVVIRRELVDVDPMEFLLNRALALRVHLDGDHCRALRIRGAVHMECEA